MLQNNKFKVDIQLKTLIENSATLGHRSLLFIYHETGSEKGHAGEQVMVIHHLISKFFSERPSILWCHKKHSETPRVSKSVLKNLEKSLKSGKCDISAENAFHIFLLSTQVTFCNFTETQNVLGKTFGMCVIQDFEGLSPNILCRMMETVSGGGAVVFLLPKNISNLKCLLNLPMDVHSKLKTYSHPNVDHKFNERFVLSLGWCKTCLVLDRELKAHFELASQKPIKSVVQKESKMNIEEEKLKELFESLSDAEKPLPQLAKLCRTVDQAKAVLKMIDVITDKNGRSTVAISAGRGRGKSSALGLATAAAIYFGVNNIYVTSPSPENLSTYFQFLFKGFDALDYEENDHYDILQSTNPEFRNAIIRVNVFARHRQVIQYVSPADSQKVSQAELVIIDEAASIPLLRVKALLGFHNAFMASTINGYEGTGRSLSLKLLKQLRQQTVPIGATATSTNEEDTALSNCRPLHEVNLEASIRYQPNDPVEKWMTRLLCLDATSSIPSVTHCPHADTCELYYVNRDVLLSGHPDTEDFLHQIISLLVSSHYRNSPDDLQILSDSTAHHLFVLLPLVAQKKSSALPTVFSVIQVCVEGSIPSKVSRPILERGESPEGDLIPWTLASQFFNPKFTKLKGVRVVRIATHPDYQSMGYGSRALKLLKEYYEGRFLSLDEEIKNTRMEITSREDENGRDTTLIGPRTSEEPLLMKLNERTPEPLDYIGVSYGITEPLFKFWKKSDFLPLHISQSTNKITGEHNCIMIHLITEEPFILSSTARVSLPKWLKPLTEDFFTRFTMLLAGSFKDFSPQLTLSIISSYTIVLQPKEIDWFELECLVNGHDLHRIESYIKNLSDRHLITDLLPAIASLFFNNRLPSVHLSPTQSELLLGCGLQFLPIEVVSKKLDLPIESALGQFNRAMKRLFKALSEIQETSVAKHLPKEVVEGEIFSPVTISLEQDLEETAQDFENSLKASSHLGLQNLSEFAIRGDEKEWNEALKDPKGSIGVVTVKRTKRPVRMTDSQLEKELSEPSKKKKNDKGRRNAKTGNKRK